MLKMFSVFLAFSFLFGSTLTASNPDEIFSLPGLKFKINFRQYSGYLNASEGKYLHYWFVESQKSPAQDPLVLWMNGGPGCSSLDGFLSELGPFHVLSDGKTLYNNPFSWNKVANVIFLEAPAGVGYSYSDNQKYSTDDDTVSLDNYLALQSFFKKFPQFRKNDFYITGESYGGIYIPTLSVRVLTGSANINFKGFAIGNGFLDVKKLGNSLLHFGYNHGLFDSDIWDAMIVTCCNGCPNRKSCDFIGNTNLSCIAEYMAALKLIQGSDLNMYNIYQDCAPTTGSKKSRLQVDYRNLMNIFPGFNQLSDAPPCIDASNITGWLNQKSVRQALHIPLSLPPWEICSAAVESGYRRLYNTMQPQILKLVGSGKLRGLIYNGDVDMACNFLGDEWFVEDLKLESPTDYQLWSFNNQTAGFFKTYKNLSFVTVKGSGHMVPQDKPGPALKMISSFLYNKPY